MVSWLHIIDHGRKWKDGLVHLFYPHICAGCGVPLATGEEVLCLLCETLIPLTSFHHIPDNATALRLLGRVPFTHATSYAYFTQDGLLQQLIHELKYKGKKQYGLYLGKLLGKAIASEGWMFDAIVPVPLFPKKELKRGYNQSTILASGISEMTGKPVLEKAMVRARYTESQTDKTREERIDNVKDAFRVLNAEAIRGKHVLLVDDVMTTGATIEACIQVLTAAGAEVSIATIGLAD